MSVDGGCTPYERYQRAPDTRPLMRPIGERRPLIRFPWSKNRFPQICEERGSGTRERGLEHMVELSHSLSHCVTGSRERQGSPGALDKGAPTREPRGLRQGSPDKGAPGP
jgi:hypothetical protein